MKGKQPNAPIHTRIKPLPPPPRPQIKEPTPEEIKKEQARVKKRENKKVNLPKVR